MALAEVAEEAGQEPTDPTVWAEEAQIKLACRQEFEGGQAPCLGQPTARSSGSQQCNTFRGPALGAWRDVLPQFVCCERAACCCTVPALYCRGMPASFRERCQAEDVTLLRDSAGASRGTALPCSPAVSAQPTFMHSAAHAPPVPCHPTCAPNCRPAERDELAEAMDVSLQQAEEQKKQQKPLHERSDDEILVVRGCVCSCGCLCECPCQRIRAGANQSRSGGHTTVGRMYAGPGCRLCRATMLSMG